MKLSKKGEYALKALTCFSFRYGETIQGRALASQEKIPYKFSEQILYELVKAGYLKSRRGASGGYTLARAPGSILLGEVIRLIDGPLAPTDTAEGLQRKIKEEESPGLYSILLDVRNAVSNVLDQTTLADVCERTAREREKRVKQLTYSI